MTMCPRRKSIEEEKRMGLEWHCPLVVPDTSESEARSLVETSLSNREPKRKQDRSIGEEPQFSSCGLPLQTF